MVGILVFNKGFSTKFTVFYINLVINNQFPEPKVFFFILMIEVI